MLNQTYSPPDLTGASGHTQPCNRRLSSTLDIIIIALDAEPRGLRRQVLKLHKRLLEVNVPAWQPTNGGRA